MRPSEQVLCRAAFLALKTEPKPLHCRLHRLWAHRHRRCQRAEWQWVECKICLIVLAVAGTSPSWFHRLICSSGFSLFSLLDDVVGRVQRTERSREKCDNMYKRLHLSLRRLCAWSRDSLELAVQEPGAQARWVMCWGSLGLRDEELSVCLGRRTLAFYDPETHTGLCTRPCSQEHC